ncbi:sulfate ABC transporter substrate-binding protein [Pectinatus sottacetonis]|uniref:sulfate ABC transporter substrate-binding protein n=1 Tax=Pectinatus sottacetonis TaxID=1002795 RepID=UPI001E47660E|nr:sulfate ABC transporter substrate-binding protein [Pectinatus sottacetonis]
MNKNIILLLFFLVFLTIAIYTIEQQHKHIELINVSYDSTRELYKQYNEAFSIYWKNKTGQVINIIQSHGGSSSQARSVIEGNDADVVTLASAYDISVIASHQLINDNWVSRLPQQSTPYTSTVIFLVREGNPKSIHSWHDLIKKHIHIITANPKTSGGGRWNYLAAWAYAYKTYNGNEFFIENFMQQLFANVLTLDSSVRSATTSFVENNQGDVLISWENEAHLITKKYPGKFEIISPAISILAQLPVALVDKTTTYKNIHTIAEAYLKYLYSPTGQKIAAENFYRPANKLILQNIPIFLTYRWIL